MGSLNIDVVLGVENFPRAGETIASKFVKKEFGGKVRSHFFSVRYCVILSFTFTLYLGG